MAGVKPGVFSWSGPGPESCWALTWLEQRWRSHFLMMCHHDVPLYIVPGILEVRHPGITGTCEQPISYAHYAWLCMVAQCMKRPVAHSLNSTWFWIELPENCCAPLKFIMKYISIQFCERPGHGRPFHALVAFHRVGGSSGWLDLNSCRFDIFKSCCQTNQS